MKLASKKNNAFYVTRYPKENLLLSVDANMEINNKLHTAIGVFINDEKIVLAFRKIDEIIEIAISDIEQISKIDKIFSKYLFIKTPNFEYKIDFTFKKERNLTHDSIKSLVEKYNESILQKNIDDLPELVSEKLMDLEEDDSEEINEIISVPKDDDIQVIETYIAGIDKHEIDNYIKYHVKKRNNQKYGGASKRKLIELLEDYPRIYKYNRLSNSKLKFELDPDNQHDSFAVKVYVDGFLLGYIPKTESELIHDFINQGKDIKGKVVIRGGKHMTLNDDDELEEVRGKYYSDLTLKIQ
ncbi:HIRAN domain-containing protein [Macrococcoides bohemicum]|uniref:HIRAN domain-containing protein n=1 Tax=Macrococcoides bohemicum TaxID=1903056 RepID=A0AAJ4PAL6_9STAP|nr:HIRAN domain-containing protein [Macrococcus bohemicus]QYA42105.1 HIRAN domain-containing protein [Macrococcus bohemicus]